MRSTPGQKVRKETFVRLVYFLSYNSNEECYAAKGKPTCSCFKAQLKFINFLYTKKNNSQ